MAKKEFQTKSKELLELMIHSIYSNKEIFIRELISNASDALTKRHFNKIKGLVDYDEELFIKIDLDQENRKLIISDNGIGMNEENLDNFLGTIANSGTKEFVTNLKDNQDLNAIGQFGVGFYSAYLVAKEVTVETKKDGEKAYVWTSDGISSYEVNEGTKQQTGTTITLVIKDGEEYDKYLDSQQIQNLIKKHSDFISYPIKMDIEEAVSEDNNDTKIVEKIINSQKAIWKKERKNVSEQEYNEFYQATFADFMDPIANFGASVEGTLNFDLLCFIPNKNPYMNMMGEQKNSFKLYSKEVLIADDATFLLPDYLKFIAGVVDCSDLNLNISREMLQQDHVVNKLKSLIEKRIVKELLKIQKKNFEQYTNIWTAYSRELTFGIYNDFGAKKDLLKDLLMFKTNKSNDYITLKTYVTNNEQLKQILYAVGSSVEVIKKMPVMEQFENSNEEVLFFLNDVDEFAIKTLESYQELKFVSVSNYKNETEKTSEEIDQKAAENKEVLDKIKDYLAGEVTEVKLTDKLKNSVAKLSSNNDISIEMEKTLQSNEESKHVKAEKVLELNLNHKIFAKIVDSNDEDLKLYAKVLLDQAKLVEGLKISDPIEYVNLVNQLLAK